jgi:hypothetical protein
MDLLEFERLEGELFQITIGRKKMRYPVLLAPLIALLFSLPLARAGEFDSPEGFKLTYPDDWKEATKEQLATIAEKTKKITGADPGITGFISGPASDQFAPNINMILLKARLPLNPASESGVVDGIKKGFTALGGTAPEIKSTHMVVDDHKLFSVAYEKDDLANKRSTRIWTIIVPTKNGTCVMTCTALKSQWAEAGPAFKAAIKSLKFDGVPK